MANRYWVGGTANWDGVAGTKWALTSGGAGGQAVPTIADDVFFDAASGANNVGITANVTAKSLTLTGFPGSFSGGSLFLSVAGNVTFDTTYSTTSTAILVIRATSIITSNGAAWGGSLIFNSTSAATLTIVGDASFRGYSNQNNNVANSVNGANIYITGGTYTNISFYGAVGTTNFILSGNVTVNAIGLNDVVVASGANTVNFNNGSTYINFTSCKLSYVSGLTTCNPLTWFNVGVNVILDTSLMTFTTFFAFNTSSVTLLSNLNCTDIVPNSGTSTINGFKINVSRNLTMTAFLQGTTSIDLIGPGVWRGIGQLKNNLTIKSTAVIDIVGIVQFNTGTFIVESGAQVNALNSSLLVQATATTTFDISTIKLNNFYLGGVSTVNTLQLNSPLYITGTAYLGASSQPQIINGSPVYIENGILASQNGNAGTISGTSEIIGIGDKFTYLDAATPVFQGQGTWRLPITINVRGTVLMYGRLVISTGGSFNIQNGTVDHRDGIVNRTSLLIQANTTLTNIDKCKFKNITVTAGVTITMNKFFTGSPEFKSIIRSTTAANFTVTFTDSVPKKAYFVNVKNCTINQTLVKNQLNIIGRDANAGSNIGILFGESGVCGLPMNQYPIENSYPTQGAFLQGGLNN